MLKYFMNWEIQYENFEGNSYVLMHLWNFYLSEGQERWIHTTVFLWKLISTYLNPVGWIDNGRMDGYKTKGEHDVDKF